MQKGGPEQGQAGATVPMLPLAQICTQGLQCPEQGMYFPYTLMQLFEADLTARAEWCKKTLTPCNPWRSPRMPRCSCIGLRC